MYSKVRITGLLAVTGWLLSLLGCKPRLDVGLVLLSLSSHTTQTSDVLLMETARAKLSRLCGSPESLIPQCIAAQGHQSNGPFLIFKGPQPPTDLGLYFSRKKGVVDSVVSGQSGGVISGGSVSYSGNLVLFTQSSHDRPASFALWMWDARSRKTALIPTVCFADGGSISSPYFNTDESAILFICYKRNLTGGLKTRLVRYNVTNMEEETLLGGDPVVSAVYSSIKAQEIAAWSRNGLEIIGPHRRDIIVKSDFAVNKIIPANNISWSGDGLYLLFCLQHEQDTILYAVDIDTKIVTTVRTFPKTRLITLNGLIS